MEISVSGSGRDLTLRLQGELDHHGARGLIGRAEQEIDAGLPLRLVLDFSGVTFMDSSGIGLVLGRYKLLSEMGGKVELSVKNSAIRRIFEMSGVNKLIRFK